MKKSPAKSNHYFTVQPVQLWLIQSYDHLGCRWGLGEWTVIALPVHYCCTEAGRSLAHCPMLCGLCLSPPGSDVRTGIWTALMLHHPHHRQLFLSPPAQLCQEDPKPACCPVSISLGGDLCSPTAPRSCFAACCWDPPRNSADEFSDAVSDLKVDVNNLSQHQSIDIVDEVYRTAFEIMARAGDNEWASII